LEDDASMTSLPIFPLGSVLFPHMPLSLRVFEERYLKMIGALLEADDPVFGVVLIERGSEVGGGDQRFSVGTTAKILEIQAPNGPLQLLARGHRRFRIQSWTQENPYPEARVEFLENLDASGESNLPGLKQAEGSLRELLRHGASGQQVLPWPSDVTFSEDPDHRIWQLVGVSPFGPLDQQRLLEAAKFEALVHDLQDKLDSALKILGTEQTEEY